MSASPAADAFVTRPRVRRRVVLVAGVGLALAVVVLVRFVLAGDEGRVDRARALAVAAAGDVDDIEAAERLAAAGALLAEEASACDDRAERCASWRAVAGYAQVVAIEVLGCTEPGRALASRNVVAYLDEVRALEDGADTVPDPPPLPDC